MATGKSQAIQLACIIFLLDSFGPENLDFIQQATQSLRRVLNGCGLLPIRIHLAPCGVCGGHAGGGKLGSVQARGTQDGVKAEEMGMRKERADWTEQGG